MASEAQAWEERVQLVRKHYEEKGYRVHSGLQFGAELVLYADDPSRVHSDFCVHIIPEGGSLDFRSLQSLVRIMPALHKTLILANPVKSEDDGTVTVEELAMVTEHAPFRHRKMVQEVGEQRKRKAVEEPSAP